MGIQHIFKRKKPEYHLENSVKKNMELPRIFLIPNREEIENLDAGDLVRLIFVMETPLNNGCRAERMWVRITDKQNGVFKGVLDNEPCYLKSIKFGDTITFKAENIASIYGEKTPFNEKLFAIITKKALDNKQINWVFRTDDLNNEQDSGWQLFYGDESEEYLEDSKNSTIISLELVLSFEPLLESVFCQHGYAYEYSKLNNKFIEVKSSRREAHITSQSSSPAP